jgi:transcriptional regulator with XRE-family HTH domain
MERKATYIRAWRNERGYSLDDMVGRLAVLGVETTGASLSRIERGIQPYNQDMLEAIASALNVPSVLLDRTQSRVAAGKGDRLPRAPEQR